MMDAIHEKEVVPMRLFHAKLDLAKADKSYYSGANTPQLLQLEQKIYLAIADKGAPDSTAFASATEALFTVAYGIKRICKDNNHDFTVPKLEGLGWVEQGKDALEVPREEWQWKLLIRMPEFVSRDFAEQARANAIAKKKELNQMKQVAFETLHEGLCVQMLHIGPYSTEPETIAQIQAFMREHQLIQNGLHHEIYLSDPRKVMPASLKTILRFPVKKN
jgi:hypothetical protein